MELSGWATSWEAVSEGCGIGKIGEKKLVSNKSKMFDDDHAMGDVDSGDTRLALRFHSKVSAFVCFLVVFLS